MDKVARGAWRVPPTRASLCVFVSLCHVCVANDDDGTHRRGNALEKGDRSSLSSSRSVDADRLGSVRLGWVRLVRSFDGEKGPKSGDDDDGDARVPTGAKRTRRGGRGGGGRGRWMRCGDRGRCGQG